MTQIQPKPAGKPKQPKTFPKTGEEFFVTWGTGENALPVSTVEEGRNLMALYRGLGRDGVRFVRGIHTMYDEFIKKGPR